MMNKELLELRGLLHKRGICATSRAREPILPFGQAHEKVAEQLITKTIELCDQNNIGFRVLRICCIVNIGAKIGRVYTE